ncbi:MAG: hypothetical protein ACK4QL_05895 [Pseudanabaenaceae cyanobacterium]
MFSQLNTQLQKCRAAIAFYTVLPVVSQSEELAWQGIALYGPLVGVGLGLTWQAWIGFGSHTTRVAGLAVSASQYLAYRWATPRWGNGYSRWVGSE